MSNHTAFFDLPLRTELITSACRMRCAWCEHCRERELPPESTTTVPGAVTSTTGG